jgi:hypothetical protein
MVLLLAGIQGESWFQASQIGFDDEGSGRT